MLTRRFHDLPCRYALDRLASGDSPQAFIQRWIPPSAPRVRAAVARACGVSAGAGHATPQVWAAHLHPYPNSWEQATPRHRCGRLTLTVAVSLTQTLALTLGSKPRYVTAVVRAEALAKEKPSLEGALDEPLMMV